MYNLLNGLAKLRSNTRFFICLTLLIFMGIVCGMVYIPWMLSLSSTWVQLIAVIPATLVIFLIVVVVSIVERPEKYLFKYNDWWVSRQIRKGRRVPENRLTAVTRNAIRSRWPGIFMVLALLLACSIQETKAVTDSGIVWTHRVGLCKYGYYIDTYKVYICHCTGGEHCSIYRI